MGAPIPVPRDQLLDLAARAQRGYHAVQTLAGDVEPDARVVALLDDLFAIAADVEAMAGERSAFVWPDRRLRNLPGG